MAAPQGDGRSAGPSRRRPAGRLARENFLLGNEPAKITFERQGGTEVEASLRRLRVERIDLYQMHWPAEDGTPLQEYWQVFTDLKDEGKIRASGLSNHGISQLDAAEQIGPVDAIQPQFNLIHRDAARDVPPPA